MNAAETIRMDGSNQLGQTDPKSMHFFYCKPKTSRVSRATIRPDDGHHLPKWMAQVQPKTVHVIQSPPHTCQVTFHLSLTLDLLPLFLNFSLIISLRSLPFFSSIKEGYQALAHSLTSLTSHPLAKIEEEKM